MASELQRSGVLALIALLGWAQPVGAAPAPIVFDFEDGLQGWFLFQGARREETSALGGSYAVFGTDSAQLRLNLDLTGIGRLTLEQLWISPVQETTNLVTVRLFGTDADGNSITKSAGNGASLIGDAANLFPNPDFRSFDISGFLGTGTILIRWNSFVCIPEDPCFKLNFIGYVDNITFHPVPEVSSLALLASGLAALGIYRRRIV